MTTETRRERAHAAIAGLRGHSDLAPLAAELLWRANQAADAEAFLAATLPGLMPAWADWLALVAARSGQWTVLAETGQSRPLPTDLLADLDLVAIAPLLGGAERLDRKQRPCFLIASQVGVRKRRCAGWGGFHGSLFIPPSPARRLL